MIFITIDNYSRARTPRLSNRVQREALREVFAERLRGHSGPFLEQMIKVAQVLVADILADFHDGVVRVFQREFRAVDADFVDEFGRRLVQVAFENPAEVFRAFAGNAVKGGKPLLVILRFLHFQYDEAEPVRNFAGEVEKTLQKEVGQQVDDCDFQLRVEVIDVQLARDGQMLQFLDQGGGFPLLQLDGRDFRFQHLVNAALVSQKGEAGVHRRFRDQQVVKTEIFRGLAENVRVIRTYQGEGAGAERFFPIINVMGRVSRAYEEKFIIVVFMEAGIHVGKGNLRANAVFSWK